MAKIRVFREFVWTLLTAAATKDVHDIAGIMQDLLGKIRGWKLFQFQYTVSTTAAAAADASETYVNVNKNIAEAAHHVTPTTAGDYTEAQQDGVLISDFQKFASGEQLRHSRIFDYREQPVEFDGDDRLNIELTFDNKDAAEQNCIFRLFIDCEIDT